ncbi:MAG: hypothetical protein NTY12_04490 [Candidatus Falkowbacteria bacterium]|nr:hypothetical protein [Candidatus Falkowbacteria bacterium]
MTLVKKSDLEKPWESKAKCTGDKTLKIDNCDTEFEISDVDVNLFHYFGTHAKHEYFSVKCPICGKVVKNLKIPQFVIDRWKKNHPDAKSEFDGNDESL